MRVNNMSLLLLLLSFLSCLSVAQGQKELTDLSIRPAVILWDRDPSAAEAEYGHIEDWNTENVTSFRYLFQDVSSEFDFDLNGWQTSKVTSLFGLAQNAPNFNAKPVKL